MDEDKDQSPFGASQLESQSRLLIELGEPEAWLETMLRASRRSAEHEASVGNEPLAIRWRKLAKGLEYAIAATDDDPISDPIPSASDNDGEKDQSPSGLEQPQAATDQAPKPETA